MRAIFNAIFKFQSTSLHEDLSKGPGLLNNLIGVLIKFGREEFALRGDIAQMFHHMWREHIFCSVST